jgi:alpha-L-fucosidase
MSDAPHVTRRGFLGAAAGALAVPAVFDAITAPHATAVQQAFTAQHAAGASHAFAAHVARVPVPTPSQLLWQQDELALFIHFGVNTFTDREWGDGREDPRIFAPSQLDARQWARAARAAGFRALVLTAKHHDGFCLWPTRTTQHSVAASPWRGGSGDVVRELVDACAAEGLRAGLYCSPWDRNAPAYGDSPRYNDMFCDQLTELLTNYGAIHEVWFDGANGEGPNGRRQEYDWPRFWSHVRALQPDAVIFSDAGPDVRWIGNEAGIAGDPCWSTVDPVVVPVPGMAGADIQRYLQHGDPAGTVWRPGEADVSIRPGWFYHPAEDARVRSVDNLIELYCMSVGRNSKLLLNVPPTPAGLLHETDVARLAGMRARLDTMFGDDVAADAVVTWRATGDRTAIAELDLRRTVEVSIADMREDIVHGQAVAQYSLLGRVEEGAADGAGAGASGSRASGSGEWRTLSTGTTIGYRKIDRFEPVPVSRVRLVIEDALRAPRQVTVRLYP